jgi:hypothetical protein
MDFIVTEAGIYHVERARLVSVGIAQCREHARRQLDERGLPRARPATPEG